MVLQATGSYDSKLVEYIRLWMRHENIKNFSKGNEHIKNFSTRHENIKNFSYKLHLSWRQNVNEQNLQE